MKAILFKFKYVILAILVLFILYFALRTPVLRMVFSKVQTKLKNSYALNLQAEKVYFTGFKTVTLKGLRVDLDSSNLIIIDSLKVNPKIFPLITGNIILKEIDLREGKFNFDLKELKKIRKASGTPQEDSIEDSRTPTNYAQVFYRIINTYFEYFPSRLKIDRFTINYEQDTLFTQCTISDFLLKKHRYTGNFLVSDNKMSEKLIITGTVDDSERKISFTTVNAENKTITFPFIGPKWKSVVTFDTLSGEFSVEKYRNNILELHVSSSIKNFIINDERIGPEPVVTKRGHGNLKIRISERAFEIDSISKIAFNDFEFSPYFKFEKNPNRIVTLKVIRQEFEASKLFKSFPEGLFDNVNKLETKGNLVYSLSTSLNLDFPDSATLDSKMENKGFSIIKYGGEDFRKMNGSFRHEVYERNRLVRTFIVGPENPNFTPISQISPYLRYSILTSEDGDFYYHKGFNQDAFRESISKNWQEKKFARGGSTISMQLVKNVFLSRKKTIARKVEEMLIVWMIENLRLTSKERMYEVYLNIIEWGPDVYGIKEASRFYFSKMPSQLNLEESIFLASIVPRPKGFKYAFDSTARLRSHYNGYYRLLSGIMLRRNQITPEDTVGLKPDIEITGAAKNYLAKREEESEDYNILLEPKRFIIDLFKKGSDSERDDINDRKPEKERKGLFRRK